MLKSVFFRPFFLAFFLLITLGTTVMAQYSRGNSPYSRYGLGDLTGSLFTVNGSMGGGLAGTYRSYWDVNLSNPAGLGMLRFTSFQIGLDYRHSELSENSTNQTAQADNGNLTYISLAFPITRSWEVMMDTLRRGAAVQWGMGFSLSPYSFVGYDVEVFRTINDIPDIRYNYKGEGSKYRVNWSNGITYKGFSIGANVGLLFGKISNTTFIDFQDSTHSLAFDDAIIEDENGVGFIWDVGLQYEIKLNSRKDKKSSDNQYSLNNKIIIGAYAGGCSDIATTGNSTYTRFSNYHGTDTILNNSDVSGTIRMPLKFGGGLSFGNEMGLQIGVNYETEMWSLFSRDGIDDSNLTDGHRFSVGMQYIPDIGDFSSFLNRMRYRFGLHYAMDPRVINSGGTAVQLMDYGLSLGFGLPLLPPKSKSVSGFLNIGFDVGYLGHPSLINDVYFKVNLGFNLNASGWFRKSKFL
jgi:hypothetical protein